MKHWKIGDLDFYEHRAKTINRNYGGWVIEGDWSVYKTLQDARNAIDKRHDGSHKAEPRIIRTMTKDEFIHALS